MLNHTLEENRKLKELIIMYEKTIAEGRVSKQQNGSGKLNHGKAKGKRGKKASQRDAPLLTKNKDKSSNGPNAQNGGVPARRRHGCKLIDD